MTEIPGIQIVADSENKEGASPLLWGGALSLLTLAFLAVMLYL